MGVTTNYSQSHAQGFTTEGSVVQDKLFDRETITRKVIISSAAAALGRGALLGKITTGGKYILSLSAASDGSQVPDAVLLHDVPDSGSDQEAIVAISGRFNGGALVLGASHTLASIDAGLRDKNIYLETIVG